jgi:hypothetical protein
MSKKEQSTFINPDNYYDLSKPFESQEAASEAIEAFWNDFYDLRNKHRITDAYLIIRLPVKDIGPVMTTLHAGDSLMSEQMTAWAMGREASDRQAAIAKIIDRAGGVSRKASK